MDEYIRRVFEGEAPCDKCSMNPDCKQHEWACRAFSSYVRRGTFEEYTARIPTRQLYNIIFKDDDIALKNYFKSLKTKGEQDDLFE
jgi:hypothetical protein